MSIPTIALLVLAHGAPKVLAHHARLLSGHSFRFFVHLDKKINIDEYKTSCCVDFLEFLPEREEIFWGGFNMIRATIKLARFSLANSDAEYFCLLSDDSFSLFSAQNLRKKICEFGSIIQCYDVNRNNDRRMRYDQYYYFDSNHTSARHIQAERRNINSNDLSIYEKIKTLSERGKRPISLFAGSQWWILSRNDLNECLKLYDNDPWLAESFEFSAIPDEMFFQTLFCESQTAKDPSFLPRTDTPMLADFSRNPKPYIFSNEEDVKMKVEKTHLFIRKVAEDEKFLTFVPSIGE